MSKSESKSLSPKKIWAIGTFRNKNVTFGQNTSGFQDQKQWPPKFQIKFRNTGPSPPYLGNIPKKYHFLLLPKPSKLHSLTVSELQKTFILKGGKIQAGLWFAIYNTRTKKVLPSKKKIDKFSILEKLFWEGDMFSALCLLFTKPPKKLTFYKFWT